MSASMKSINRDARQNQLAGPMIFTETLAATGLTANSANTIPWPVAIAQVPVRVSLTPVGDGAVGAVASLDTSQGAADPSGAFAGGKLGMDVNNLYCYIGNATQLMVVVEYGPE